MSTAPPIVGLDPRTVPSRTGTVSTPLTPRPISLDGATLGIIGNGLNRGNELLDAVAAEIGRRAELAATVTITKRGVSVPPDPADWSRLTATATVAITGFGGCGSCSSRSMRDAIELEAAGIPTAAIIHESMAGSASAIARLSGRPDYAYAVVPAEHKSIATWPDAEIAEIARAVVSSVIALLTD